MLEQECQAVHVKPADRGLRVGEAWRQWPISGQYLVLGDAAVLSKLANFLVGEDATRGPGQDVVSAQFDAPVRAGVGPGADRDAMQPREMSAAADEPAKVA